MIIHCFPFLIPFATNLDNVDWRGDLLWSIGSNIYVYEMEKAIGKWFDWEEWFDCKEHVTIMNDHLHFIKQLLFVLTKDEHSKRFLMDCFSFDDPFMYFSFKGRCQFFTSYWFMIQFSASHYSGGLTSHIWGLSLVPTSSKQGDNTW